jgi:hypothetical protein
VTVRRSSTFAYLSEIKHYTIRLAPWHIYCSILAAAKVQPAEDPPQTAEAFENRLRAMGSGFSLSIRNYSLNPYIRQGSQRAELSLVCRR